jgi:hypothetical protein
MPIEATPFEQDVLAEATNLTDEPTVPPFPGLDTDTLANAVIVAKKHKTIEIQMMAYLFI